MGKKKAAIVINGINELPVVIGYLREDRFYEIQWHGVVEVPIGIVGGVKLRDGTTLTVSTRTH
ncbi:MAG TPA: hypothetical protein VGN17_26215 [Bryobacteraceae bacterium]|jgi:hypothetical protein